jgi:hypothetical protein
MLKYVELYVIIFQIKDKCLITEERWGWGEKGWGRGWFMMHDLLQELGRYIVR